MPNDFVHIYTGSIINTVQKCLKRYQPSFYKLKSLGEKGKKEKEAKKPTGKFSAP